MSNVTAVLSHFSTSNEGFQTTIPTPVTAGAITVPLASTTGLVNGTIFVGIIEPTTVKQQVFTGTVDIAGTMITGVVWTRGTNVDHAAGVTIVDYVTGTDHNMATKGILVQHTQTGAHGAVVAASVSTPSLTVSSALTIPANAVLKAGLEKPHYNALYMSTSGAGGGNVFGAAESWVPFDTYDSTNGYGIVAASLGVGAYLQTARAGIYNIDIKANCIDVAATQFICWFDFSFDNGVTWNIRIRNLGVAVPVNESHVKSTTMYLPANTRTRLVVYNGGGLTRFGSPYADDFSRRLYWSLTVSEVR